MSSTPTPRPKLSASERLQLIQNQANQPVSCEKCGSQWFSDVSFQQYSGSRYSSTPGGDMQVISSLLHRVRVCLCGHPYSPNLGGVRPGRTAAAEVSSFMDSFNLAKTYLQSIGKIDPEVLANDFPTRKEYQELTELVEDLKANLNITGPPTSPLTTLTEAGEAVLAEAVQDAVDQGMVTESPAAQKPRAGGKFVKNPIAGDVNGK